TMPPASSDGERHQARRGAGPRSAASASRAVSTAMMASGERARVDDAEDDVDEEIDEQGKRPDTQDDPLDDGVVLADDGLDDLRAEPRVAEDVLDDDGP